MMLCVHPTLSWLLFIIAVSIFAGHELNSQTGTCYMHVLDRKQVDILISKNQALQILYLKHCVYKTT